MTEYISHTAEELSKDGPKPLGKQLSTQAKMDGCTKFKLYHSGMDTKVDYLLYEHSKEEVARVWLKHNQELVEEVGPHKIVSRFAKHGKEWSNAISNHLEYGDGDFDGGNQPPQDGGVCPRCGDEYSLHLADHLPDCNA